MGKYIGGTGLTYLWGKIKTALDAKQATLTNQTAYTSKGTATKVPQITTNTLGQVTSITEVNITHPDGLTSLNESIANIIDVDDEYADIGYFGSTSSSVIEFQGNGISLVAGGNSSDSGIYLMPDSIQIYIGDAHSISISVSGIAIDGETVATQDWVGGQGYTTNIGTITGITMNGASKGTSGVVNLGTVITAHQDISGKVDKTTTINGKALSSNITLTASDVSALPASTTIPTITFRQW